MQPGAHKGFSADLTNAKWYRNESRSADGGFVEVAFVGTAIYMRKADEPDVILAFTYAEWLAFVEDTKEGNFSFKD